MNKVWFYAQITINGSESNLVPLQKEEVIQGLSQDKDFTQIKYYNSKQVDPCLSSDYNVIGSGGTVMVNDKGTEFSVDVVSALHNKPKETHIGGVSHLQTKAILRMRGKMKDEINLPSLDHIPFTSGTATIKLFTSNKTEFSSKEIKWSDL